MPEVGMAIRVAQDRQVAAIEIAPPGQSPLRLVLGLDELDRLIAELGNARSQIVSSHPQPDLESDDVTISTVTNAKWYFRASPPTGALFAFNHPKFGPVGLTLPREQIVNIVTFLTDRFILQPAPSPEKH